MLGIGVTDNKPSIRVLLIDDDPDEGLITDRTLRTLTDGQFDLTHVTTCSNAMRLLNTHAYDLILLDDRLSQTIDANFTVVMLRNTKFTAPIVISTNNEKAPHLDDPARLGVTDIINKMNLSDFLRGWLLQFQSSMNPKAAGSV
jgi:CheY-like chemotaxis protein